MLGGRFDDDATAHGGLITISGGKEPPTISHQCLLSSPPYLRFNSIVVPVAEPISSPPTSVQTPHMRIWVWKNYMWLGMRWRIRERLNREEMDGR